MGFDNDHLGTLMLGAPSTPSFQCSLAMAQFDPLLTLAVSRERADTVRKLP